MIHFVFFIKKSCKATDVISTKRISYSGLFNVHLIKGEYDYWYMKIIQIDGFNPGEISL